MAGRWQSLARELKKEKVHSQKGADEGDEQGMEYLMGLYDEDK